ncbi:hypothetical protein [Salipiger mucosus]|uniref:Uncharacterized protein n=1 Tax=Salipiger mucosus DSM 16094 TaxID=1123237 RepID=S9S3J5_9RHOB|nr:hypothetical protein [Salipiger mucosus]EPX84770.1 hypothetical protein Salmuc_01343 [Salipiger mucosus DSM 16094]
MDKRTEQLTRIAAGVREFLAPRWPAIHAELDPISPAPAIPSTHCCRESSVFGLIVLEALGFEGWRIESGDVPVDESDTDLPLDILDIRGLGVADDGVKSIPHTWLVNDDEDLVLDLTADQFGSILVSTADVALLETATTLRETYVPEISEHAEDSWSDTPDLISRPVAWTKDPEFSKMLATLSDDLWMVADLDRVRSVPPADIHDAISEIRACSFDDWMPTDPISALEKIELYRKLDAAQASRPHPQARQDATEALRDLLNSTAAAGAPWDPATPGADPETERAYVLAAATSYLLREDEIARRVEEASAPTP